MTRVHSYEIGDYVAQDDRTTAVDQFLNVHDLQRFARNWNCNLARCLRQPVLSMPPGTAVNIYGIEPVTATSLGDMIGPLMVPVPRHCQTMTLYVRGGCGDADADVFLYPAALGLQVNSVPGVTDSDYRIQVTGTAVANYSCTVHVDQAARDAGYGFFAMGYVSEIESGEGVKQTLGILDAGADWVVVDASPNLASRVLTFVDPAIGRQVGVVSTEVSIDATTGYRITVARPWARVPTAADTCETYELGVAVVRSMVLFPDRATTFSGSVEI